MIIEAYTSDHADKRNLPWFQAMWNMMNIGGELATSNGTYIKTQTGFIQKK